MEAFVFFTAEFYLCTIPLWLSAVSELLVNTQRCVVGGARDPLSMLKCGREFQYDTQVWRSRSPLYSAGGMV